MNWSTRLRRWVRIRTPPVREASMKPTAATVLPAPVACSNQKRRLAPGSSGASSTTSSSSASARPSPAAPRRGRAPSAPRRPRLGDRAVAVRAVGVLFGRRLGCAARPRRAAALRRCGARRALSSSAISAASVPESASTWCSLSSAPSLSFGGSSASSALEAEQQRVAAPPLDRGLLAPRRRSRPARRRRRAGGAVPGARSSGLSPSSRIGSRANFAARSISALGRRRPLSRQLQLVWPWKALVALAGTRRLVARSAGKLGGVPRGRLPLLPLRPTISAVQHNAANRAYQQ